MKKQSSSNQSFVGVVSTGTAQEFEIWAKVG